MKNLVVAASLLFLSLFSADEKSQPKKAEKKDDASPHHTGMGEDAGGLGSSFRDLA